MQATTPTVATAYSLRTYRRSGATSFTTHPPSRCWLLLAALLGLNKVWAPCHTLPNAWQPDYPMSYPSTVPWLQPGPSLAACIQLQFATSSFPLSQAKGACTNITFPPSRSPAISLKPKSANGVLIYCHIHDRTLWSYIKCVYIFLLTFSLRGTERPIFVRSE